MKNRFLFLSTYFFMPSLSLTADQKTSKIGLCVTATKKRVQFLEPFLASCRKHFLKNHVVTYFMLADQKIPTTSDVVAVPIKHKPWPCTKLLRFEHYYQARDLLLQMDYVFASDINMRFIANALNEMLGDRATTTHPGFFNKPGTAYTFETNPSSTAYIAPHGGKKYYTSGLYGGSARELITLLQQISKKDLEKNYISIWHDESHQSVKGEL